MILAALASLALSASPEEVSAAEAALAHELLVRAKKAAGVRRESPILFLGPDGVITEGILDLAFRETTVDGPIWTVVDFKTDVEIAGRREDYRRQIGMYAAAVAAATGERARGVLLSI